MPLFGEYICSECGAKYREDHKDGVCVPSYNTCSACRMESVWVRADIIGKIKIEDNRELFIKESN